jgi:hypothetical protein
MFQSFNRYAPFKSMSHRPYFCARHKQSGQKTGLTVCGALRLHAD